MMDNNRPQQIQLTVSLSEVNQILETLGQLPYAQVYQLIAKVQQQAESQLHIQQETTKAQVTPENSAHQDNHLQETPSNN